jgi:hypothetical protein
MTSDTLNELWEFYGEAFRLHAHQLLAWAYSDVRPRLKSDMEEPDITGLLAEGIRFRLDHHPDTPEEYLHYYPGDQVPISPEGQLGNDRLRLDITVIRTGVQPRISFIFEAKRLRTGGFPIGKYTGDGGMGDFIACRYGTEAPEAAMVGLFQNKEMTYWHGELSRVFNEDQTAEAAVLGIHENLSTISILASLPGELRSVHRRTNGECIGLYHIFLDCCELAPA